MATRLITKQTRLSQLEWDYTEKSIPLEEKIILKAIIEGYAGPSTGGPNDNIVVPTFVPIYSLSNIRRSPEMDYHLYKALFEEIVSSSVRLLGTDFANRHEQEISDYMKSNLKIKGKKPPEVKKEDVIRVNTTKGMLSTNGDGCLENIFLQLANQALRHVMTTINATKAKKSSKSTTAVPEDLPINLDALKENTDSLKILYSLAILMSMYDMVLLNPYVVIFLRLLLSYLVPRYIPVPIILDKSDKLIEDNEIILKYRPIRLYDHQREIFNIFRDNANIMVDGRRQSRIPRLVLYIAPTGTGKTVTPLGLCNNDYKVIFVCAARHVGLALARSALQMKKKVAFCFGQQIRLHHSAAVEFKRNERTGTIYWVNPVKGERVELMICDALSYSKAMHYMLQFVTSPEKLIFFWDEPTISLDYEEHPLHGFFARNWQQNEIPNIVLSSATLPKERFLGNLTAHFISRFSRQDVTPLVHTITSSHCDKTIVLLNERGYPVSLHTLPTRMIAEAVQVVSEYRTLLRYLDFKEIIVFLKALVSIVPSLSLESLFPNIEDITMENIKLTYLKIMTEHIVPNLENTVFIDFLAQLRDQVKPMFASNGNLLTTVDAHTLVGGPTLYLGNDVDSLVQHFYDNANLPEIVLNNLLDRINANNESVQKLKKLQKSLEDLAGDRANVDVPDGPVKVDAAKARAIRELQNEIEVVKRTIKFIRLDPEYIPNTITHQRRWVPSGVEVKDAFVPTIEEVYVSKTAMLDIDRKYKVLLLLGVGAISATTCDSQNQDYFEIMSSLASDKKLFVTLAGPDYIYGLNYQFNHLLLGRDLHNMTQQKIIQALGRAGRTNKVQTFTVRIQDDYIFEKLFSIDTDNIEARNLNALVSMNPAELTDNDLDFAY